MMLMQSKKPFKDPITSREAAEILNVAPSTVRRMASEDRQILRYTLFGRDYQFSKSEVERLKSVLGYMPWKRF